MIKYAYVIVLLIFLPTICKAEYCEYSLNTKYIRIYIVIGV